MLVVDADHVLRLAAHAVLGPEEAHRADADLEQPVDGVREIGGDAGRMAEHPDAAPPQEVEAVAAENIEPGLYGHRFTLHHGPDIHVCAWPGPSAAPRPLVDRNRLQRRLLALGVDLKRTMRHFHFCLSPPSMRRSLAVKACTVIPLVGLPWLFSAATYSLKMRAK